MQNNLINLVGTVTENFKFSHTAYNEDFYLLKLHSVRDSGVEDEICVLCSALLYDVDKDLTGKKVHILGSVRTFNYEGHLLIHTFVDAIHIINDTEKDENNVELEGYICKMMPIRTTPFGKIISDIVLAVNRPYGKSDYIPCICWGRNAEYVQHLDIGTKISMSGRLQSRDYLKNDTMHTVYELSVQNIN